MKGFLSLSLSRFLGKSGSRNLERSTFPFAGALAFRLAFGLGTRLLTGVALPLPLSSNLFTVPPSSTPFAWTWNCLSRVGSTSRSSRASNSVPSPQIPLAARGRCGRLTSTAPAGSGTVTLAFAKEEIVRERLAALIATGEVTRGLGKGGFLRIAANDLVGVGTDLDGAIAAFDHALPVDELEVVLALRNIFLTVGLAGAGLMNPCSRTAAVFWVGVLGRVVGTIHLCWSGDSMLKPRPSRSEETAPSRSYMPSADRAREAAVGASYDALKFEADGVATVTAENEGERVGRTGRETKPPSLLTPRVSLSENTPATESTKL